jgi:hypothetical protein
MGRVSTGSRESSVDRQVTIPAYQKFDAASLRPDLPLNRR